MGLTHQQMEVIQRAHSSHHREDVLKSPACGCFCCEATFTPAEIREWIDNGQTAVCPRCGVDAVLGSTSVPIEAGMLKQMRIRFFDTQEPA